MRPSLIIASLMLLAVPLAAQRALDRERTLAASATIRNATAELRRLPANRPDSGQYRQRRDELRGVIHRTVDGFVEAMNGNSSTTAIEEDLSTLLVDQLPEREYGDTPTARTVVTRDGTGLIVTYNILGARHDSTPTVRAYLASRAGPFRLVATEGADFVEGFTVHSRTLRAPLPSEGWVMVWGKKEGYNGTLIRFRLYAFDGETIRTLWAPEDMLNAEVAIRDNGFEIKHLLKNQLPWQFVRDDFLLTVDGPLRVSQRPVD